MNNLSLSALNNIKYKTSEFLETFTEQTIRHFEKTFQRSLTQNRSIRVIYGMLDLTRNLQYKSASFVSLDL